MATLHPFASDCKLFVASEKVMEEGGSSGATVVSCLGLCNVMMRYLELEQPFFKL